MKVLWKEYLQIPAEGHMSDRVFFTHLAIHICVILLCLACIAYSAYALFSSDISTAAQTMAVFDMIQAA